MQNSAASRYQFIAHALNGDGPFRPVVSHDAHGQPITVQSSYLVRYPRESDLKFSRRNEVAFFDSPMAQATGDFVGYLSERNPVRNLPHALYKTIADDADGKGNSIDVFWQAFMIEAKARGCMCLLVDMPAMDADTMGEQISVMSIKFRSNCPNGPSRPETMIGSKVSGELFSSGLMALALLAGSVAAAERPRWPIWHPP